MLLHAVSKAQSDAEVLLVARGSLPEDIFERVDLAACRAFSWSRLVQVRIAALREKW